VHGVENISELIFIPSVYSGETSGSGILHTGYVISAKKEIYFEANTYP